MTTSDSNMTVREAFGGGFAVGLATLADVSDPWRNYAVGPGQSTLIPLAGPDLDSVLNRQAGQLAGYAPAEEIAPTPSAFARALLWERAPAYAPVETAPNNNPPEEPAAQAFCGTQPDNVTQLDSPEAYLTRRVGAQIPPWAIGGGVIGNGGEVNTASNVGGGAGLFKQKTGADLEFKSLTGFAAAGGVGVALTPGTDEVQIGASLMWPIQAPDGITDAQYTFDGGSHSGSDRAGMGFDQTAGEGPALLDVSGNAQLRVLKDEVVITDKLTVGGLIDPTGVELNPVGANPGGVAANTLWLDSGAGDKLKWGADLITKGNLLFVDDNSVARVDGSGGNTIQGSQLIVDDISSGVVSAHPPSTSGATGNVLRLLGGDSSNIIGAGGNVVLRGGGGNNGNGKAVIGDASTSRVEIGASGVPAEFKDVLEIGHANDTTLSRKSAGVLQVQANELYMQNGTDVAITDGGTGASSADGAIAGITGGATSRTPVLTDEVPFNDVGTAGGKTTPQGLLNLVDSLTEKTTIADADDLLLIDSAASHVAKRITGANLKAAVGSPLTAVQASDQNVASTTMTNATGLQLTLVGSTRYRFEAYLVIDANSAGGWKFDLDGGTATVTSMIYTVVYVSTTGTAGQNTLVVNGNALATDVQVSLNGSFTNHIVRIEGHLNVNSGGTFVLRFARAAGGGSADLNNGSHLVMTKLA